MTVAHIAALWRYPVKSMHGEQVDALDLIEDGIALDRRYGVESAGAPRGKPMLTGRERAGMLLQRAMVDQGETIVETSDGLRLHIDDPALPTVLEALLQQRNSLRVVSSERPLTDVRPIAVLSFETIAQLSRELGRPVDLRRFRANIVLSFGPPFAGPFPEDALVGRTLQIGETARLRVTERDPRCRIVTLDPITAAPDPTLMKHLDCRHDGRLGIYAATVTPGPLRVGDAVCVVAP